MAKILDLGHSCFQMEIGSKKIITDPFIHDNPLSKDVNFELLEADIILVSHGHADHTADLLELAKQTNALVISNFEITTWLQNKGYANVHGMNMGGSFQTSFGRIKLVRADHSSSFADGTYAGNPLGFVIDSHEACIYFAGDTSLFYDMKLIEEEFNVDLAILPLGDTFTMGIDDAAKCAEWLKCEEVVGMHYDSFELITIDHAHAEKTFEDKNIKLHLLGVGNTLKINKA